MITELKEAFKTVLLQNRAEAWKLLSDDERKTLINYHIGFFILFLGTAKPEDWDKKADDEKQNWMHYMSQVYFSQFYPPMNEVSIA